MTTLPTKEDAQELVRLWDERYANWIKSGKKGKLIKDYMFNVSQCPLCAKLKGTAPSVTPYANCPDCKFFIPCFTSFAAMKDVEIHKTKTPDEGDAIFQETINGPQGTHAVFAEHYGK